MDIQELGKNNQALILAYKKGYRIQEDGSVINPQGTQRKTPISSRGYSYFSIYISKAIRRSVNVHRLMGYQKFGARIFEKGIGIRHLDNDKTNNSFENIGIGTCSENAFDRPVEDRLFHSIKASTKTRKFTDAQVKKIRRYCRDGHSYSETMRKFGISSKGTMSRIININYQTSK